MTNVLLKDLSFTEPSISRFGIPRFIVWNRNELEKSTNNLVVFTDLCLRLSEFTIYKGLYKIGLLLEPSVIFSESYNYVAKNYENFDKILIHDSRMLEVDKRFQLYIPGMVHLNESDFKIYPKNKTVSIIASNKNWAPGHQLRSQLIHKYNGLIDVMGSGYGKPLDYILDGLKDYRFNLSIENCQTSGTYFTEKLNNAMLCGCVAIYWGNLNIDKFYNPKGIIFVDRNIGDYLIKLKDENFAKDEYESRIDAIKENFERAKEYTCGEDWIYEKIFKPEGLI